MQQWPEADIEHQVLVLLLQFVARIDKCGGVHLITIEVAKQGAWTIFDLHSICHLFVVINSDRLEGIILGSWQTV